MCTNTETKTEETSTDLMPCIMEIFDTLIEEGKQRSRPERAHQSNKFAHLSPSVQKLISHIPEHKLPHKCVSKESLETKCATIVSAKERNNATYNMNKSNESLDTISPTVQKLLSNLPDSELIIPANHFNSRANFSFLHSKRDVRETEDINTVNSETEKSLGSSDKCSTKDNNSESNAKPVGFGSFLHTSPQTSASRKPLGKKIPNKFLNVPNGDSLVVCVDSNNSPEVSRPLSLTSIGSCSSSESSCNTRLESMYLPSAESLESDSEVNANQGSADSGISEQSTTISAEFRVLQEVIESEQTYVTDLQQIIEGYLKQWRSETNCSLASHLEDLFSNIEEIYEFNRNFLELLKKAEGDSVKIANVFLQNDSGFSVYNEYCTHYPRTMDILGELTRDEKMVPVFREKQLALGHALPLASYLLKPVQRILKYHLLLQRLSKQCDPAKKHVVELALTTMTGIASDINTMKQKHEHAVRVQEIQSQLYGWNGPNLTALGELIAEGTFRVLGYRGRRHVFLFDKVFLMCKSKQGGLLAYKFHIMCSNLMLVEQVRGEPLSFQVLPFDNPRLQCTLRARSVQHKREWTLQIKQVILENYSVVIPNHARQLVMQLGQNNDDIGMSSWNETPEKWSTLKYSTPHYLERRSRLRNTLGHPNSFASLNNWKKKNKYSLSPSSAKTLPNKVTKSRKQKAASTFYTDLPIIENLNLTKSTDNLSATSQIFNSTSDIVNPQPKMNIEKVVADIVHEEFEKLKRCQSREKDTSLSNNTENLTSEKILKRAGSLPKSFQLNEKEGSGNHTRILLNESPETSSTTVKRNQSDTDITSHDEELEHPDHKIYRKSTIRVSLLQRIRTLLSEQQKRTNFQGWRQEKNIEDTQTTSTKSTNSQQVDEKNHNRTENVKNITLNISNTPGESSLSEKSTNSSQNNCVLVSQASIRNVDGSYSSEKDSKQNLTNDHENEVPDDLDQTNRTGNLATTTECDKTMKKIHRVNEESPPIPKKPIILGGRRKKMDFNERRNDSAGTEVEEKTSEDIQNNTTATKSWVKAMIGRFE